MGFLVEVFLPEDFSAGLKARASNAGGTGRQTLSGKGYGPGHFPPGGKPRKPGQPGSKVEGDPEKIGELGEAYSSPGGLYIMMKTAGGYSTWYVNDKTGKFEILGNPMDIKRRQDALNVMRIHHDETSSGLRKV